MQAWARQLSAARRTACIEKPTFVDVLSVYPLVLVFTNLEVGVHVSLCLSLRIPLQ